MLEIRGDLFTFGGEDNNYKETTLIHKLTCLNLSCEWTTIDQKLKTARYKTVAIPVGVCSAGKF